jgi:hypothetical protein
LHLCGQPAVCCMDLYTFASCCVYTCCLCNTCTLCLPNLPYLFSHACFLCLLC